MQAWEDFLIKEEKELGAETVRKWLRPLKILRYDACNLYLEAKDSFQAIWFEEHIRQKIQSNFFNNNNKKIKVHLNVGSEEGKTLGVRGKLKKNKDDTPFSGPPPFAMSYDRLDPFATFDNFITTGGNILAHKVFCECTGYDPIKKSLSAPPKPPAFNPILLYGRGGTGKTHLLMAASHSLTAQGLKTVYVRAETFTEHVVTAIRAGEMSTFRQSYRNIDALIIDDVHVFSRKGATQEEFFHTFNTLHLAEKQIFLSANCAPQELQFIEPRLISRFEWGIVLPLHPMEKEEIRSLVAKKLSLMDEQLHPKVIDFLLDTFQSSTKAICRALEALILRTHMNGQRNASLSTLTQTSVKNILSDLIQEEEHLALTPSKIIQTIAEFYGIKAEDIQGKAQSRDCSLPRQIAMYLCRSKLKIPFVKIGDLFGRDHSTVMSSVKLIEKELKIAQSEINASISSICNKL